MVVLGGGAVSYERGTPVNHVVSWAYTQQHRGQRREREFFIDNLLVQFHIIIVVIRWTGLAPWEFEFPFPGSPTSAFLANAEKRRVAPPILRHRGVVPSHPHLLQWPVLSDLGFDA